MLFNLVDRVKVSRKMMPKKTKNDGLNTLEDVLSVQYCKKNKLFQLSAHIQGILQVGFL